MRSEASVDAAACRLCGGSLLVPSAEAGYCCEGCARVAEILEASGESSVGRNSATYLTAARLGLVATGQRPAEPKAVLAPGAHESKACWTLEGLWCPSCAWLVESVLERTQGVRSARVTFFADLAEVTFDPVQVGEQELVRRVTELGYRARAAGEKPDRGPLLRFGVAAFLQMNVMWLSYALYAHRDSQALGDVSQILPWVLALLSAPVVFVAGAPMMIRAWRALRAGALVMDSLIAFAALAAWAYSLRAALVGSEAVYFDSASGLVAFRLAGRLLEQAAFRSSGRAAEAVRRLLPRKARRRTTDGFTWVAADSLVPGDRIRVAPGERVPLDGRLTEGSGRVSTAVVDGEPRPRAVAPGDLVLGGAVCGETALDFEVTARASASMLARVADHVARASGRRGAAPEVADALARLFIPGVLVLSGLTFAAWLSHGLAPGDAFLRALSVLVVSCPCALGLAAPLCRVITAGALARRGIIVRGEGALDEVAGARRVTFDKTGTLTQGRPRLLEVTARGASAAEAVATLAALEERSTHPIALAARAALPAGAVVPGAREHTAAPGLGVRAVVGDGLARAGRPSWVFAEVGPAPAAVAHAVERSGDLGHTVVAMAWGVEKWAAFSFGDPLQADAAPTVADLALQGLGVAVLSGDSQGATEVVARAVGAALAVGDCLPEDKARRLERLTAEDGARPLFVGDGINDAPGLAAGVGVAVASGTDFARETAHILLLEPGIAVIPGLVREARRMRRLIRQNLAWAALYNAVCIPLAAFGRLTPVWAALAMVTSGLLVVLNALRLQAGSRPAAAPLGREPARIDAFPSAGESRRVHAA